MSSPPQADHEERNFRPTRLAEFVGQSHLKDALAVMLAAARKSGQVLEHVLFHGPPGLGKTSLSQVIANELGVALREVAAPILLKPGDLAAVLVALGPGDVFFLDEAHRLKPDIAELLYSAVEDFRVSIRTDPKDPTSPPITLPLPRFTLVGATTEFGLLPGPLRDRFGQVFALELYTLAELEAVIARAATHSGLLIEQEALQVLASRARGTPRVALRLFRRCRDMALVQEADGLTVELAHQTLALLRVDALGLDESDRRYLRVLSEQYHGGPVGPRSLAASAGLDLGTIESAIEPWLLRSQLIVRTRHGRQLTPAGLRHLATGMESVV